MTIQGLFRIRKIRNLVKIMIPLLSDSNAKWWLNCVRTDAQLYLTLSLWFSVWDNYQMALLLSNTNPFILSKNHDLLSFGFKNVRTDKIVTNLIVMVLQVNNYEIVINFLHISHNLTWCIEIVNRFTRIYPVCSTYEVTKQFMYVNVCKKLLNRSQKE